MNRTSRTLLIVDDSPEDRELYRRYLSRARQYSYTVLEATLGQQGLELWQQHQPDAVLLDYRLPDLDGLEFLDQLHPSLQQPCPVIMVTGYGNEAIAVQAMKAGAQDYLVKEQITPEGLQLAVNDAIEKVQLRTELYQRIERERLVARIMQHIHRSLDLEEILQTTVDEVRQFLHTDRVIIFRLESDSSGTVITESVGAQWRAILSSQISDPCFVESYCQGLVTTKTNINDGTIAPCHVELLAQFQVKANLVVPILQDKRLWGTLVAHHCTAPRQWQPLEVDLLKELATQVGIALQQAELYQQAQNELAERRRVEAELREGEERFRTSVETMLDCFGIYSAIRDERGRIIDFRVEYVNDAACFYNRLTREEQVGRRLCEILPGHVESGLFDEYCQVVETGQSLVKDNLIYSDEFRQQRLVRAFDIRVAKLGDGFVATWRDITDRKQAETALEEGQRILDALMEYVPEGITLADAPDVTIRRVSHYGQQLTGRPAAVLEGIPVEEHAEKWGIFYTDGITPANWEVLPLTRAVQKGEVVTDEEWMLRRPDGAKITILCNAGPIYVNGEITGGVIAWRDISDRVQFERDRELILQQEQAARAEAERANRVKDEFLAILSHELRSPLNPILGWSKLLQTRNFDATKTAQALATIERNAKLQTQLIDDLLDMAKILRGKLSMETAPVNLAFVIEAAIDTVRAAAVAKSILIHPVLPAIGQISGDGARLQQIVWNLLSNAVKFTSPGGRVDIRLARVGDRAQITVSDTGKGINPDFLPYLFESFRQEDNSTARKHGGLGLGLAIVRQLVEAHGGTITADSPGEGLGATFTVQLPLLDVEPKIRQTEELPEQEPDLTGIRVLTVDDEPDARALLTALLTQYGAEVTTVASAAEVLATLESFQPDVLVSDIGMPDVDGYVLIQQIRALPPEKGGQIPAIALTAYARAEDRQQALNSGYQRHVTKPIEPEQFVQAVMALALFHQSWIN